MSLLRSAATSSAATTPSAAPARAARALLTAGAVVGGALLAVALVGLLVDPRSITGAPAWLKPAKFGVSTAIFLLTLRWVLGHVEGHRRTVTAVGALAAVALAGELALIGVQAARGTTSHFNTATALDGAVFQAMGGLVALVLGATAVTAVLVLRQRGLDAGLAASLRWGLGVCLLGMLEAGLMIANRGVDPGGAHTVGGADGGPGLPVTGWSTVHGDLRVSHFVGLHALQVLPLLAWALARWTGLGERARARLVGVAGTACAGLVVLLAWQAERGQALLRPDGTTLLALAVLLTATAVAAGAVLAASGHRPAAGALRSRVGQRVAAPGSTGPTVSCGVEELAQAVPGRGTKADARWSGG